MFLLSTLLFSQAATVSLLMPVGLALGLPVHSLVGFYPASNGLFFLPTLRHRARGGVFRSDWHNTDRKVLLNHSFMRPGLVTMVTTVAVAQLLSSVLK